MVPSKGKGEGPLDDLEPAQARGVGEEVGPQAAHLAELGELQRAAALELEGEGALGDPGQREVRAGGVLEQLTALAVAVEGEQATQAMHAHAHRLPAEADE